MSSFEGILDRIGSFGLYQKVLCFVLIPATTGICGLTYYAQIFILTPPPHMCREGFMDENNVDFYKNVTVLSSNSSCGDSGIPSSNISTCKNGWIYDYDTLFPTLSSQNDWVCDNSWKPYTIITCFWIGNTIGAWIFGTLSDMYGRRPVVALSHAVYAIAGVASVFVTNFYLFIAFRMLLGSAHHTVTHLPFVMVVEFCGVKSRVIPLLTIMMTYTIASIIAPLLAIAIWQWRILAIVSTAPAILVALSYRWLPESPSWLLTNGRKSEAIKQLVKIAKVNGYKDARDEISDMMDSLEESSKKKVNPDQEKQGESESLLNIFTYPKLRRNVILVLLIWMLGCMCFYGHAQNTASLGSNIFTSYLLGACVEIPSWSVPFAINKVGRKPPLMVAFFMAGIAGIVYSIVPIEMSILSLIVALIGRMFVTAAYYITLQFGPEVFPTVVRGRGVAVSETLGGVAIFVSPLVVYLGELYRPLPLLIFGVLSLIGCFAALALPETAGQALPQTLQDGDNFKSKPLIKFAGCRFRKNAVSSADQYTIG